MYSSSLAQIWILLILLHVSCCNSDDRPLVHTKYGPILGKRVRMHQYNPNLQDVMQFLGIPYARAPVKDLRFRPPEKPEKWKIVRNCTHFAPVCPQPLDLPESQPVRPSMKRKWKAMKPLLGSMDEDCLYLNVYHPADVDPENIDKKERYPLAVMVFVHGGDFVHGAGSMYDGSVLASHGTVVVVTVNYRIGILGYLSTTDNSAVGNYALMDQIAALRWVNDNIANFKGDPTRVTLFGPETGAVNINLLTLAPEAAASFFSTITPRKTDKFRDPNSPIVQKTRFVHERPNRYEEVEWLSYRADNDSDFYMYFGMKPRVPKGYRSQRVAFWVELVPKLLRPKQVRNSESALVKDANELCELLETGHNTGGDGDGAGKKPSSWIPMKSHSDTVRTTCMPFIAIPTRDPSAKDISWPGKDITWVRKKPGNSSELSIVIAVGTSLFFLNVVVFAVCYHRRNNKPIRYSEENAQERVRLKVTDVREVIKALELEDCTIGPNGECQLETTELAECSSKVI
uniref:Carboxylesterase type B domain-containing protein n=1 Tax=Branchiostoma floridae TaxID=7739 RepID=C3ZS58_BRAFL|eukprot:XP_002588626.1 hypothetical protein BRAFLDRAFT_106846 [Branchiostoma floridae]